MQPLPQRTGDTSKLAAPLSTVKAVPTWAITATLTLATNEFRCTRQAPIGYIHHASPPTSANSAESSHGIYCAVLPHSQTYGRTSMTGIETGLQDFRPHGEWYAVLQSSFTCRR